MFKPGYLIVLGLVLGAKYVDLLFGFLASRSIGSVLTSVTIYIFSKSRLRM